MGLRVVLSFHFCFYVLNKHGLIYSHICHRGSNWSFIFGCCTYTNICMQYMLKMYWTDIRFECNELGITSVLLKPNKSLTIVYWSDQWELWKQSFWMCFSILVPCINCFGKCDLRVFVWLDVQISYDSILWNYLQEICKGLVWLNWLRWSLRN